jgi:hypothetical protein
VDSHSAAGNTRCEGCGPLTSKNSVATGPGHTVVTATPQPRSSAWSPCPKESENALAAPYVTVFGTGWKPDRDDTMSTAPDRRATIAGVNARLAQDAHLFDLTHRIQLGEPAVRADAGVVDEHVDAHAKRLNPIRKRAARLGVGEVAGEGHGADSVLAGEVAAKFAQPFLAARDQRDTVTEGGQLPRYRGADARRRAGDQTGGRWVGCR